MIHHLRQATVRPMEMGMVVQQSIVVKDTQEMVLKDFLGELAGSV